MNPENLKHIELFYFSKTDYVGICFDIILCMRCNDNQQNDISPSYTLYKHTQYNIDLHIDNQNDSTDHNDTQHNNTQWSDTQHS